MPTEINFRLADAEKPIILVPTFVNGRGPYDFVLDTGASVTVLSAALAQSIGIKSGGAKEGMGCGAGGKVELSTGHVKSLAIGGAKQENLQVAIADLSALSQAVGAQLEGIVGYNYLKDFKVTIDYSKTSLSLA
ncbi:MAG: TIGR02281 family clan AA aspartic protease [Terriglobia bacterium]